MKPLRRLIAALAVPAFVALAAGSASAEGEKEVPARYQILAVKDGFVRLDTQTGTMVHCQSEIGNFNCAAIETEEKPDYAIRARPDGNDTSELETRIGRLEARIKQLEERSVKYPSEEDLDRTFSMMERFMRRFMDQAGKDSDETSL